MECATVHEQRLIHQDSDDIRELRRQIIILNNIIQDLQEEKLLILKRLYETELQILMSQEDK